MASYLAHVGNNNHQHKGVLLYGNQGTGKSMYSNLIQYEAGKKVLSTVRATQREIYSKVLDIGENETLRKYIYPKYLFLDEVGRVNPTENLSHVFFELINKRYSMNLQTIITSNLMTGIGQHVDVDRLKEFIVIKFEGESRRGK